MDYKLIDIPNSKLDEIINSKIEKSEKILIVVSFIFTKGLDLFFSKLKEFKHKENITIITSNYLNCTEPSALRKLLELKKLGANIYFFDATKSKENFHIKSYNFENKNKDFFSSIIGSSNISYSAFKQSHELNVEINNQDFFEENKKKLLNFLTHDFLFTLNEKVI